MKRINRRKLIVELEFIRQGLASAVLDAKKRQDKIAEIAFTAHHKNADMLIVELGGESVL